jgi:hypothetical protein
MYRALEYFPTGNAAADGARAVQPLAMILTLLRPGVAEPKPEKTRE